MRFIFDHKVLFCLAMGCVSAQAASLSPLSLESVLKSGAAPAEQASRLRYVDQVEAYLSVRRSGERAQFTDTCEQTSGTNQNIFCPFELRLQQWQNEKDQRRSELTTFRNQVSNAYYAQDLRTLEKLPKSVVRDFLQDQDGDSLQPLANKVIQDRKCDSAAIAFALAQQTEELLPAPQAQRNAYLLYRKAGLCGRGAEAGHALVRAALFVFWQMETSGRNECSLVEELLAKVSAVTDDDSYLSRASYWRYICALRNGRNDLAQQFRDDLWVNYPISYHTMLAMQGSPEDPRFKLAARTGHNFEVSARSQQVPSLNPLIAGLEILLEDDSPLVEDIVRVMGPEIRRLEPQVRLYLVAVCAHHQQHLAVYRLLSSLFRDQPQLVNRTTLQMYFPDQYSLVKGVNAPDGHLVLGLIMQESSFNPTRGSHAGAMGLMQLMPGTAAGLVGGANRSIRDQMMDPKTNVKTGVRYLTQLLERFSGDVEYALIGYNGGPNKVARYRERYPVENRVLFLDFIPNKETRNYVPAVMRNYAWYVNLYGEVPFSAHLARQSRISSVELLAPSLQAR